MLIIHLLYIDDGGTFKNMIKQSANVLSLNKFDYKLGNTPFLEKAFNKAWQVVCSTGEAILVVPQGNYLLKPIRFSGPCKPNFAVQISGTLEASDDPSDYSGDNRHWLVFDNIQKLFVYGGGTINGNGNISWQNSCKRNKKLKC
ncbi:hypothetical protein JHK86_007425 [Glycine max]|nr:hypothetical protein JHK86_007425 [Glycine max]